MGTYPISVGAVFFNETFTESYKKTFFLTVWDDDLPEEESWFPEDPIYYPEWEPENYIRTNMTQEEDPDRPIPYIVNMEADGTLIIGWDREMNPPGNITEIPPTKIAVEANIDVESLRFWENRRWL